MAKRKATEAKALPSKRVKEERKNEVESDSDKSNSEMESSSEEEEEEEAVTQTKSSKPTKKQLTSQDIQIARETAELYKNNIFKLKIDELLKELKLDEKASKEAERTLFQINDVLKQTPESSKELSVEQVEKYVGSSITIPFPDPKPKDVKYKFTFERPDDVNVVGSYSLKTAVTQPEGVEIDLYVSMPESIFQENDYKNYRYFHKRAFYLAVLAKHIKASEVGGDKMKYGYFKDDVLRPILKIKINSTFSVNIIPGVALNIVKKFGIQKLGPNRAAVRLHTESSEPDHEVATPLYNSSILSDALYTTYQKYLHTAAKTCEGFVEACKLGRLWLRQRGFTSSPRQGGFGHFEFAMLMAVLLLEKSKVLLSGYTSFQLFKTTLKYLATELGHGAAFGNGSFKADGSNQFDFPALLFDSEHHFNIFYKLSGWSTGLLRHEAAVSTDLLSDVVRDRFDALFMRDVSLPHIRFDVTFNVTYQPAYMLPSAKVTYSSYRHFVLEKLWRALKRGYGDRVKQIALFDTSYKSFGINRRKASEKDDAILVGLIADPQECDKSVTHGPDVKDEKESQRFRGFWGQKAELRRFQDGSISESVVWGVTPSKPAVISIAEYLLSLHFSDSKAELEFDKSLFKFLPMANVPGVKDESVAATSLFSAKYNAFQKLSSALQALKDVPLLIRSVVPTSSSLRFTSLHQPVPFDMNGDDAVAEGIIDFETSSRWPDDLAALEKTKTAFLLKISQELEKQDKLGYISFVGVDPIAGCDIDQAFLFIQTKDGYLFKLRIRTDWDEPLYEKLDRNEPFDRYKQQYTLAMAHTRTIYRMALRYPYYSASARLLKQWFSSQLLMTQVREEIIELLALVPFVDSAPYEPPASPVAAFHRVIDFLARWDWRDEPLILDIEKAQDMALDENNTALMSAVEGVTMSQRVYVDLAAAFTARRTVDPTMKEPLFIATAVEPTGIAWRKTYQYGVEPFGKLIASRVTALARGVSQMCLDDDYDISTCFTPALSDFDFVVETRDPHGEDAKATFKNLSFKGSFPPLEKVVDATARTVELMREDIAQRFAHELIIFGGNPSISRRPTKGVIAAIWQKDADKKAVKFKVNLPFNVKPDDDGEDVVLNKEAIYGMIARLGGDLVHDIDLNRH